MMLHAPAPSPPVYSADTDPIVLALRDLARRLGDVDAGLKAHPETQRKVVRPAGLLSLSAVARRLGRSKATIRKLIDEGSIRAVPWPGRRAKDAIPLAEIERIEREGVSRPVQPRPKKTAKRAKGAGRSERAAAVAAILAVEET